MQFFIFSNICCSSHVAFHTFSIGESRHKLHFSFIDQFVVPLIGAENGLYPQHKQQCHMTTNKPTRAALASLRIPSHCMHRISSTATDKSSGVFLSKSTPRVCIIFYLLSRYTRPVGPWQRLRRCCSNGGFFTYP